MAGRNRTKLEDALKVVVKRHGAPVDAEIVTASNEPDQLRPLFEKVDVVINIIGPFMQLGWPIVETCLETDCHYLDITGEQDWTHAIKQKYGQAFADKGLLLCPSCSLIWGMGSVCAEMVLEHEGIDSLDIVYQTDHGLPSDASTKSFLRMACNEQAQQYLELNELKPWQLDIILQAVLPHRASAMSAHPWGGGCEPIWYKDDERVRNCRVITAVPSNMLKIALDGVRAFKEEAAHLPQEERENWTNALGDKMATGEPADRDHED
ncbi:MAG: saccharopine dehydrogenase, partial [Actinobacteria bacterium]